MSIRDRSSRADWETELNLLVWELRDNPYRKFLVAFSLVGAIPFLTLLYLISALGSLCPDKTFQRVLPTALFFLFIIAGGGYLMAHRMLKNILDKLVAYFVRARRGDELKSKFVATISHELKSPLMVMRTNFANLSAGFTGEITEDQRQTIQTCQNVINRMDSLIRDALDLYKIEAGMVELNKKPCDLRTLLESQEKELRPLFAKNNIGLSFKFLSKNFICLADSDKMTCVFNNLLSNALKYAATGGVTTVTAQTTKDFLKIEFVNTGKPIPRNKLELIFDKFEKLDATQEGYGLGLPIAKDIVESHQGRIWAENTSEHTNSFSILLPRGIIPDAV